MKKISKKVTSLLLALALVVTAFNFTSPKKVEASGSLQGKKIWIDAGHGGKDPGAKGTVSMFYDTVTIYEKDLNLIYAQALKDVLEERGARVYMSRNSDKTLELSDRYNGATNAKVDAFISIHFDWSGAPNGLLSLYGKTRSSDKSFARSIHNGILNYVYGVNDRGVVDDTHSGHTSLAVLRKGGNFPRVLLEINNMDQSGCQGYELEGVAQSYAFGICDGLENYFN